MRSALRVVALRVNSVFALLFVVVLLLPLFSPTVSAVGLVTSRSIEMSSSLLSATNTTYAVSFSIATTASFKPLS